MQIILKKGCITNKIIKKNKCRYLVTVQFISLYIATAYRQAASKNYPFLLVYNMYFLFVAYKIENIFYSFYNLSNSSQDSVINFLSASTMEDFVRRFHRKCWADM